MEFVVEEESQITMALELLQQQVLNNGLYLFSLQWLLSTSFI